MQQRWDFGAWPWGRRCFEACHVIWRLCNFWCTVWLALEEEWLFGDLRSDCPRTGCACRKGEGEEKEKKKKKKDKEKGSDSGDEDKGRAFACREPSPRADRKDGSTRPRAVSTILPAR